MPFIFVATLVTAVAVFIWPALADWNASSIVASRVGLISPAALPDRPSHSAAPGRLVVVYEADGWVRVIDGDDFQTRWRFRPAFTPRGGAVYSPDGRSFFLRSGNGWVGKYDFFALKPVARIRAGHTLHDLAVSSDGKWLLAANARPSTIAVLNADDLSLFKVIPAETDRGAPLRVAALHDAGPRRSFIVALWNTAEIWELSYDPDAAPVYGNFVHSYRAGQVEGVVVEEQPFARRRLKMAEPLSGFFFDPAYAEVIATGRTGGVVHNLDARRKVAGLALTGAPRFSAGVSWPKVDRQFMAVPDNEQAIIDIVDMETWQTVRRIKTGGLVQSLISHPKSPYIWANVVPRPHEPGIQVIDKQTLTIVKSIAPARQSIGLHAAFTRDGRHVLVADLLGGEMLKIYDALALREVKRLPMVRPRLR
ncbi:MAG: cytochrome D1 domain-containing protein [Alphaproteobacteria bacterium]|jgi:hypothetical protein|nr:cytochrome D1 domain-containing protein [Alphaproteobacteria bacterium]MDP6829996.1 cytochrome D1 domain-containing protein [Alphaproteobacteria bacterium]MDP6875495.1 cytochrome D1 domain-containing protein [Alphaproteobacteria bacterium]